MISRGFNSFKRCSLIVLNNNKNSIKSNLLFSSTSKYFSTKTNTTTTPTTNSSTTTTVNPPHTITLPNEKTPLPQPQQNKFEPVKLDGKLLSSHIKKNLKSDTDSFIKNSGIIPHLVVIYVGDNKQIESYIKAKKKGCEDVGFKFTLDRFSSEITEEQLIKKIKYHSEDPSVHGIIVQLPLPDTFNKDAIIQSIDPKKDVDGLTSTNLGQIMISKKPLFVPCTPSGILEILKAYNIKVEGRNVVVLGRSNLVGRTIATILSQKDLTNPSIMGGANVTVIHKYSRNHQESIRNADLIISATGVPGLIKKENLKKGVILIDVGISYKEDKSKKSGFKMVGDIDPEAYSKSIAYTPVPGGVGPLTVACLLRNVLRSAILQFRIQHARIGSAINNNKFNNSDLNNNNNNTTTTTTTTTTEKKDKKEKKEKKENEKKK